MNKLLLLLLTGSLALSASAQTASDQNPNYAVSRDKYMRVADSVNRWHATTVQNTYKAYDWYEAKTERRDARLANRQAVRLARAQRSYRYDSYDPYYYQPPYYSPYYRYNNRRRRW